MSVIVHRSLDEIQHYQGYIYFRITLDFPCKNNKPMTIESFNKLPVTIRWNIVGRPSVCAPCIGERLHYAARGRVDRTSTRLGWRSASWEQCIDYNCKWIKETGPSKYSLNIRFYSTCVVRLNLLIAFQFIYHNIRKTTLIYDYDNRFSNLVKLSWWDVNVLKFKGGQFYRDNFTYYYF